MTKISSYKGNPTISLASETKWPFTFGVSKAKLILENLDAIRAFVAQYERKAESRFDMDSEDRASERMGGGQ